MTTPETWLSFVPHDLAREIAARPGLSPVGDERRLDVVALFADVSGFTPISEALSRVGKVGAEELTAVLNSYFAPMIELIESYGGIIGKFGGDAMTILFPYTARTRAATARRALQCALDMQANMQRYTAIVTSAGIFGIAMRAGLALGQIFCTTVGDPRRRLEYLIAGSVLDRCADAEHYAQIGEVVAHHDVCTAAGNATIQAERDAYRCVVGLARRARPAPLTPIGGLPRSAAATIARYVHPIIAQRIQVGQTSFINEHRKVTVLFVGFDGFDYDHDSHVGGQLQNYLSQVILIIQRYDGYLNKVDMGDKGSKYIVLFGAPVAHEHDEERAIRCALELQRLGVATRIGINTGFVYCGLVGSARRQEYTVMGDPVNLAARLMQASAPQQILVSGATQRFAARGFVWEALPAISVKGKSEPIALFAALAPVADTRLRLSEPKYALPMVGRVAELEQIRTALDVTLAGAGQVIGVVAEAGMGKSRLAAEVVAQADRMGFVCYGGAAQSYGTTIAYLVWQSIWRSCLGLDPAWPIETQVRVAAARLAEFDPQLPRRLPLMNVLLNLPLPENELTAAYAPQQRSELLRSLLLTLVRAMAQSAPLLLVLEEGHWMDPLSLELLEFIGRNLVDLPICLLVLYRPPAGELDPLGWGERLAHVQVIGLAELAAGQADQFIRLKLTQRFGSDVAISVALAQQIAARAQGNPFYLEEMINFMHDRGVDLRDVSGIQALDLPDSLHSLIISRIDQLAEAEKTTLKLASVIGRLFRATWLWGSYPEIGTPEQVQRHLMHLSQLDFTPLDKPAPELEYLFKHITTLEVAYESLAVATRSVLHEQIGAYIEQAYPDTINQYLDLLAFHYGRSRNAHKQQIYFRRAADAARAAYANTAAINYYQRLLSLVAGRERAEVLCDYGQVYQLIGQWAEAETHVRAALAIAEHLDDLALRSRCWLALGYLQWCMAHYPEALAALGQAQAGYIQLGDRKGLGQTLGRIGLVYNLQGDYAEALEYFEQQAAIAAEIGDRESEAQALGHLGSVYQERGQYQRALECYERQQQIASAIGNRRELLFVIGNIGVIEQYRGNFPQALANLAQALRLAGEIGDQQTITIAAINMGEVYRAQGEHQHALACYQFGLAAAVELNDMIAITATVANIAQTFADLGRREQARQLFARAVQLARGLNIPFFLAHFLFGAAELAYGDQRYSDAETANQEALAAAQQIELSELILKTSLLAIRVRLAVDDPPDRAHLFAVQLGVESAENGNLLAQRAMHELWDRHTEEAERAAIALELWRISGHDDYRSYAAECYRSMYRQAPRAEYRLSYAELTGEQLPDPPALGPPPQAIGSIGALEPVLVRVAALIEPATDLDAR